MVAVITESVERKFKFLSGEVQPNDGFKGAEDLKTCGTLFQYKTSSLRHFGVVNLYWGKMFDSAVRSGPISLHLPSMTCIAAELPFRIL